MHKEPRQNWDCNTLLQFGMVVHVQTNMINLWILPYKCWVTRLHLLMFHIRLMRTAMPRRMKQQRLPLIYINLVQWTMPRWISRWRLLTLYSLGMCSGRNQQYRWRQIKKYAFGYKDAMQDMLAGTSVDSYLQVVTSPYQYNCVMLIAVTDASVLSLVKWTWQLFYLRC